MVKVEETVDQLRNPPRLAGPCGRLTAPRSARRSISPRHLRGGVGRLATQQSVETRLIVAVRRCGSGLVGQVLVVAWPYTTATPALGVGIACVRSRTVGPIAAVLRVVSGRCGKVRTAALPDV